MSDDEMNEANDLANEFYRFHHASCIVFFQRCTFNKLHQFCNKFRGRFCCLLSSWIHGRTKWKTNPSKYLPIFLVLIF